MAAVLQGFGRGSRIRDRMRAVFVLYLVLIISGITVYSVIGLTHH
jgi:hypothetical protein